MKGLVVGAVLLVSGLAWADDELSPPQICNDEFAECKEECTLKFGTSFKARESLGHCWDKCSGTHDTCLDRYIEVRRADLQPHATDHDGHERDDVRQAETRPDPGPPPKPPAPKYPREQRKPEPAAASGDAPPVDRTATRVSDLNAPDGPEREPQHVETAPSIAQPGSAPAAGKKATEPPGKKRKDVSEWDKDDLK